MSDAEVVRSAFAVWNTGDLDAWAAHYDPNAAIEPPDGWPEAEPIDNLDDWVAQARRLMDSWEAQHIDLDAIEEVGGRVLAEFTWVTRGKESGIDMTMGMACLTTIRDGRIVRQDYFRGREEALTALGGEDVHPAA